MHYLTDTHILLFLVQFLVLLGASRGLGEIFRRFRQPTLTAEILVGLVLGPTLLGRFLPELQVALFPPDAIQQCMLETVAWLGVFFLLLDTGLEIDFSIAWRQRGNAFVIALADIIVPMGVAFVTVVALPSRYMVDPDQRIIFALFMATVMTISAMPVAARVLHDLKLLKSDMGFLIMSALTVNDIIGWVLFTIILGLFVAQAPAIGPMVIVFASTLGFAVLALTLGRRLSTCVFDGVKRRRLPEPATSLTITVLLGLLFGAFTQKLGVHALFGFFIAGVVVGEAKSLSEQTRSVISQMVHGLFVPVFFANIGLKIDLVAHFDLPVIALLCAVGIAGRYLGAWLGVTWSRAARMNRDLIAIAHTPGGMMEIVVALVALEAGLITPVIFVAIVFSAIFSSMLMGPWMVRAMARRKAVAPSTFLAPDSVIARLLGTSREAVIEELAARLALRPDTPGHAALAAPALAREVEFGTAIGAGVAIPHARVEGLKNPVIAFGRAPHGVDWDAPDGVPVEQVFFLVTPSGTEDIHVQTLAAIAAGMAAEENRRRIRDAPDAESLYQTLATLLAGRPAQAR